jgi:hypothetical protein
LRDATARETASREALEQATRIANAAQSAVDAAARAADERLEEEQVRNAACLRSVRSV